MIHPFGPGGTGDGEPLDALLRRVRSGSGGPPGPTDPGIDDGCGETPAELALRRLMHQAVQDLAPHPDALERLRHAVPARRARRRQTLVGAAASVLLVGAAMPSLVHAADSATADSSVAAGASPSAGTALGPSAQGGAEQGGGVWGLAGRADARRHRGGDLAGSAPPSAGSASAAAASPSQAPAAVPACSRGQLGDATAQLAPADADGRVYGTFLVVNVSATSCSVSGEGRIAVTGQSGAAPAGIEVLDHTAGDPATGLPDPVTAPAEVVLAPGRAYQVRFAWIPAPQGGTGCAPAGSTAGTGTATAGGTAAGSGTTGTGSGAAGTAAPSGNGSPTPEPAGGITLTHIPQAGDPGAASVTISGACTGTVYRTAVLPS